MRAHIERRYGVAFDPPVARMRDYVLAVRGSVGGVPRRGPAAHEGRFYRLSLLPAMGQPRRHDHKDLKVDIAAVGDAMVRAAGEVADGIHVHPLHSLPYLRGKLLPALTAAHRAQPGARPLTST